MSNILDQKMPFFSEDLTEFTISKILVEVGDAIESGQSIFEVETEYMVLELPSDYSGIVTEICVQIDDRLKVGDVINRINAVEELSIERAESFRNQVIDLLKLDRSATLDMIIVEIGRLKKLDV